jgi:hypothetical protein
MRCSSGAEKTAESTITSGRSEVKAGQTALAVTATALRGATRTQPAEMPGRRLKEPPTAVRRLAARTSSTFQIIEIGGANSAADRSQVKFDVLGQRGLERAQQKASQLLAGRAAQPSPTPDFSDRVDSLVAATRKRSHAQPQSLIAAEVPLDCGHAFGRQHLVEIGQQIGVGMCSGSGHFRDFSRLAGCLPPPNALGSIKPLCGETRPNDAAQALGYNGFAS